jgi:hypothetical protein
MKALVRPELQASGLLLGQVWKALLYLSMQRPLA